MKSVKKDIAIVGISGKFSKSKDIHSFWKNLKDGKELIHFYSDEELKAKGVQDNIIKRPNYVAASSHIDFSDAFDHTFFGYTDEEAAVMDPQIRILHEQTWLALEDAGCNPYNFKGKIGIFYAASDNPLWRAKVMMSENEYVNDFFLNQISNKNFIASLIAYNLNLKGPAYYLDTACSSSLVSVHLACRNLLLRECSIALAGGVSIDSAKEVGYFFEEGMIYSKDGHCRPFDGESTGTISGEGAGVVVLKRLADALNDRDHIYAVIKASAVNNDGNRKVGYTAPSITGQYECIRTAQKAGGIEPQEISYIETHGTGTKLGDTIEIEALNKAFNFNTSHKCAIGSVKSNLGHLDSAAGICGLIKATLALKYKKIPGSLHFNQPNPDINFESGPFYVNTKLKEWKRKDEIPIKAGVSSFGIGGTNSHIILEEPPDFIKSGISRPYQIIPFSGMTESSFERNRENLISFFKLNPKINLPDVSYSLLTGRKNFTYRGVKISSKNAISFSDFELQKKENPFLSVGRDNVIFMFPGQGSQYFRMAKDLYLQEPYFREIINSGIKILKDLTGEDYFDILGYSETKKNDERKINDTFYTQPLLFIIQYALAKLIMNWGVIPANMIGHSLGEYVAACLSEVFSFEEGLKIIAKRAELMSKTKSGSMLSVSTSAESIKDLINDNLAIAAINSSNSCTISGDDLSILYLEKLFKIKNISCKKLNTSHAFHSRMMDDILQEFELELSDICFSKPKFKYISNLTGKEIMDKEAIDVKYWIKHLRNTVNFSKGIKTLLEIDNSVFIEIGPGKILSNLVKQNRKLNSSPKCISILPEFESQEKTSYNLVNAIGEMWRYGVDFNWENYFFYETRNKLSLPTYSFDNHFFPSKVDLITTDSKYRFNKSSGYNKNELSKWFYIPNWTRSFVQLKNELEGEKQFILIFSNGSDFVNNLIIKLREEGNSVVIVEKGAKFEEFSNCHFKVNPNSLDKYDTLFQRFSDKKINFQQVIFNWVTLEEDCKSVSLVLLNLVDLCKEFIAYGIERIRVIRLLFELDGSVNRPLGINILENVLSTMLKVFSQENPSLFTSSISLYDKKSMLLSQIIEEINYNYTTRNVVYKKGRRWTKTYEQIDLNEQLNNSYLKNDAIYLIIGGLGNFGNTIGRYLIEKYNSKIILIGRSDIPEKEEWATILNSNLKNSQFKAKIHNLQKFKDKITYFKGDVSNYDEFQNIVETIEKTFGNISGVLHAAGNLDTKTFKPVEYLSSETICEQFKPKASGIINVYNCFKERNIDFVWITSSLSAVVGGLSFGAYASANAFVDSFVNTKSIDLENWFCVNLDGLSNSNIAAINDAELIQVFERSFSINEFSQLVVSTSNLEQRFINKRTKNKHKNIMERPKLVTGYFESTTKLEEDLVEIWKDFFNLESVGINDDFFELGGDSLKAMTISKRITKFLGVEIDLHEFYEKSTIKELAQEIELSFKVLSLKNNNQQGYRHFKI